ncbi:MAG TPA: DNA polymerase IV [Prolixibacteraceae bacterium]|nr:DNA polymerase IV [Prolixibacteraceae bacterium]HPS11801.1 DNA polymerase IV [Prolixibacteraceae bacterium]
MIRKIIHIDMDAFFASVEQREQPMLRGKPVAVGGGSNRGVIAAASYEARKYGIHSAMPTVTALARCPHLVLVKPNGHLYKEVSQQIQSIFFDYTEMVEPLSLDEAFLDVTFNHSSLGSATLIAREIKQRIHGETQLTASAGVSYNKFLAKVASDYQKPDGLFVIEPKDALEFLEKLKIEKFYGVGKVAAQRFHDLGIHDGADLKKVSRSSLVSWFGKAGDYYYNIVRGIDNHDVIPVRENKSIGAENTFETDLSDENEIRFRFLSVAERSWKRIERHRVAGKTLTLKVKFFDFEVISRSKTLDYFIDSKEAFLFESTAILSKELPFKKAVRLLGITLSNFKEENHSPIQSTINF